MELIDVIKSSIILFIVISAAIVFLSFALYEITPSGTLPLDESKEQKILNPNNSKAEIKERFAVVNKNFNGNADQLNWRSNNYHTNVYKFYENTVSSEMFKVKVDDGVTS